MKEIEVKKKASKKKVIKLKYRREEFTALEQGKTISIYDLPKCKHKERLLKMIVNPTEAKIVVLAVRGSHANVDKWEVLAGYPDVRDIRPVISEVDKMLPDIDWLWLCENIHNVDDVMILGEKLPYDVARQLFPDWTVLTYLE